MNEKHSLSPSYFEDVYNASDDPWNFAASEYESQKYAATLAALPRPHYESAFEIGCSIGVLTEKLAARCKNLLSIDVNRKALENARKRCRNLVNIEFKQMRIPPEYPEKTFDLIVISEVGYYLSAADWKAAFEKIVRSLNSGGNVLLIHWTPFVPDYPQTGDEVHDSFSTWSAGKLRLVKKLREEKYRLDVWEKL